MTDDDLVTMHESAAHTVRTLHHLRLKAVEKNDHSDPSKSCFQTKSRRFLVRSSGLHAVTLIHCTLLCVCNAEVQIAIQTRVRLLNHGIERLCAVMQTTYIHQGITQRQLCEQLQWYSLWPW
jgi:hypothetical protein